MQKQKEYEIPVSNEVYEKIKALVKKLNKKEQAPKSWETRILEWLHLQKICDYDNIFRHIVVSSYLLEEEYPKKIILSYYPYKLLVLFALQNSSRSLTNTLELLVGKARAYHLNQDCSLLEIKLKIIQEYTEHLMEGS